MADYLTDLIGRLAWWLEQEVSAWTIQPYLGIRSSGKYVCLYDAGGPYVYNETEEWIHKRQRIGILVVSAPADSGNDGDAETTLRAGKIAVEAAIIKAVFRGLVTDEAPAPPTYTAGRFPQLTSDNGRGAYDHGGAGVKVLGTQLTLEIEIQLDVET